MDVSVIFQFLKDLAANNNREWFQGHKDEYLKAQKEFEELLTAIIARISLFDESIVVGIRKMSQFMIHLLQVNTLAGTQRI